MTTNQPASTQLMARIYLVTLVAMIVLLLAAAILAILGGGHTRLISLLIEGFALAIPTALIVFAAVSLVRRQFMLGSIALLVTLIWGAFKLIG